MTTRLSRHHNNKQVTTRTIKNTIGHGPVAVVIPYRHIIKSNHTFNNCNNQLSVGTRLLRRRNISVAQFSLPGVQLTWVDVRHPPTANGQRLTASSRRSTRSSTPAARRFPRSYQRARARLFAVDTPSTSYAVNGRAVPAVRNAQRRTGYNHT